MNKEEFLRILDRKLQVINERERRDIIDEYRAHIEMKVQEGKSEEEAIEDFGDIDELVNEILDAYKINTDTVNNSFDRKFNNFMDELFDGFKRFLGSFTSLDADDVVRLIFEVLIILLLLLILRIPFDIVSTLGYELLHSLVGFGIGNILGHLWELIIGIAYIVIFIVVLVNLIGKRVTRYRQQDATGKSVFDDFKDSMQGMTNKKQPKETIYDEQDDSSYQEEATYAQDRKSDRTSTSGGPYTSHRPQSNNISDEVGSVLSVFMKIFFCLLLIPFISIIVVLCCALGAMVVLSFEGVTFFGAYFLIIGAIFVTGAFFSALHRVLWRGR